MINKKTNNSVIELGGILYRFTENSLEQIPDLSEIKTDFLLISDMQDSVSNIVTIDAPVKYASVIVRKHVQDMGEFDSPVTIVTHWKKKINKNLTEIFYTAVPTTVYNSYFELINSHDNNVIFFPLYGALLKVLNSIHPSEPAAIVFQHSRFAEIIIGTKKQLYHSNSCVAFDNSPEQISALWETVSSEIKAAELKNKIKVTKVLLIDWLNTTPDFDWPDNIEVINLEGQNVQFHGEEKSIGFLSVPELLSATECISPFTDKMSYIAKSKNSVFNILLLFFIITTLSIAYLRNSETEQVKNRILTLEKNIQDIHIQLPSNFSYQSSSNTLSFINMLNTCRELDSFKEIMNEIAGKFSSDTILESLTIKYLDHNVELSIIGSISSPFNIAHKRYQDLIYTLKNNGYTITQHTFNTQIKNSQFAIKATRLAS